MSTMPGNDHAEVVHRLPDREEMLVEATLALAFETRTANLIAAAQLADDDTADILWIEHITPRLGLVAEQ